MMTENSIANPNSVYKDTTEAIEKNVDKDNPRLYPKVPIKEEIRTTKNDENSNNQQTEILTNNNNNINKTEEQQPLRSILKVKIPKYGNIQGGGGGGGMGNGGSDSNDDGLGKTKIHKDTTKKKKKRRDKSDLGDDFVAPDGGWGWFVAIAAGINIFVTFALAQNFGIIFRGHMIHLGINTAELTTIINIQIAVSAITGLLNGPLFRRYTFRQVALVGSVLTFLGLFGAVFTDTFIGYVLTFSCCYGLGRGLTVSASSLAVYTYFKARRRTATAYQFGVAGLGPIIFPYIATYMVGYFEVEGTVLIFSALSLHTIACSLIYQPVMWHVKKVNADVEATKKPIPPEDEMETIVEPDTPTLPRANDGWYGSRLSLNSINDIRRRSGTWEKRRDSGDQVHDLRRLNSKEKINGKKRTTSITTSIKEEDSENEHEHDREFQQMKAPEKPPLKRENKIDESDEDEYPNEETRFKQKTQTELEEEIEREEEKRRKMSIWQKVIVFFDLDLLRDFGYLNLAIGITLINFVEINFAILTPFILSDFGFKDGEIAFAMSSLGFCDLVVRFLVPLLTSKFSFSNKTFFIIGILGMCFGRLLLAFTRNFYCLVAIFIWLGLNKAFRTVFWSLIIPGYVPLKRLPAAAGLQLLMSGVFSLAFGPLIGFIRDATSYGFALQFINLLAVFACVMWIVEDWIRNYYNKKHGITTSNTMKE